MPVYPHAEFTTDKKGVTRIKQLFYFGDEIELKKVLKDAARRITGIETEESTFPWYSFPQMWGSTALGHDGIGGRAMTTAQTYVCMNKPKTKAFVYFGSKFAYEVDEITDKFWESVYSMAMPSKRDKDCLKENLNGKEKGKKQNSPFKRK